MFTGLVAERGRVLSAPSPSPSGGQRLVLGHSTALGERLAIGASLAVAGVCLTVVEQGDEGARSVVEMGEETVCRSNLGGLVEGGEVNLEPALRLGDPLGGHWLQGHVDTTVAVLAADDRAEHRTMTLELPGALAPYVAEKGSVGLDGVSLTVAAIEEERFTVWLIPHTLEVTTLGSAAVGDRLNFEADVLAKYVRRSLERAGLVPAS